MSDTLYWSDLAELTHKTQVEQFNFCLCEEQEQFPYDDCPKIKADKGVCTDCGSIIDFDEDGGHIYPDGSVPCPDCEGKNE